MPVSHKTSNTAALVMTMGTALFLTACAAQDDRFPSLERRTYETAAPITAPVPPPVVPTTLTDELTAKVKALVARHQKANASFEAGLAAMQSVAARAAGTKPGTESWVNAHLQLSRLDKSRADSVAALGAFDALIAEQIDRDSNYVILLSEYQHNIAKDVLAQRAEIDRMSRQIGE